MPDTPILTEAKALVEKDLPGYVFEVLARLVTETERLSVRLKISEDSRALMRESMEIALTRMEKERQS